MTFLESKKGNQCWLVFTDLVLFVPKMWSLFTHSVKFVCQHKLEQSWCYLNSPEAKQLPLSSKEFIPTPEFMLSCFWKRTCTCSFSCWCEWWLNLFSCSSLCAEVCITLTEWAQTSVSIKTNLTFLSLFELHAAVAIAQNVLFPEDATDWSLLGCIFCLLVSAFQHFKAVFIQKARQIFTSLHLHEFKR